MTNTGNVTLNPVTVTDPMSGLSPISCPATSLAPGVSETCTATYTTTQADVDRGSLQNTGTATGTPPSGPNVTAQSSVSIPAVQTPSISVVKSADVPSVSTVGQVVTYTFTIENTGNVTLSSVGVGDAQAPPSLDSSLGPITCVTGTDGNITLAPGATDVCSATYTVTQADLTNNSVTDTATVTGQPPNQLPPVTGTTTLTLLVASVSVVKSAAPSGGVVAGSATPVVYTLTVTNTGSAATTAPIVVTDAAPLGTTLVAGSPACATGGPPNCTVVVSNGTITWRIPAGVNARCVLHAHVPGDGKRDHCNGDHHQHGLVERPGMRPTCGGRRHDDELSHQHRDDARDGPPRDDGAVDNRDHREYTATGHAAIQYAPADSVDDTIARVHGRTADRGVDVRSHRAPHGRGHGRGRPVASAQPPGRHQADLTPGGGSLGRRRSPSGRERSRSEGDARELRDGRLGLGPCRQPALPRRRPRGVVAVEARPCGGA